MLVSNWKEVLAKSATVWVAVAGALLPEVPDLLLKWLADESASQVLSPEAKNWIRGLLLFFAIPMVRIIRQKSIATATEQQLAKEKAVSKTLEQVATSEGPPITKADVEQIKREAAWQANPKPLKE